MDTSFGVGVIDKILAPVETIILTITNKCNLGCVYCHNRHYLNNNYPKNHILKLSDFEKIVHQYASYLFENNICRGEFCFSGGEPLSVGIDYFKKIISIEKKVILQYHNKISFTNLIQTNGTLIDKNWISFFKKNKIKIGISIDTHKELKNFPRKFLNGNTSFNKIKESIRLLRENNIEFGFLSVVSTYNKNYAKEIIKEFISLKPDSIAFIPCLDYDGKINAEDYSKFLTEAFDCWLSTKRFEIPIRNFKFIILRMLGIKPTFLPCENSGNCPSTININLNGDVFICDVFMGKKEGYIGNIHKKELKDIFKTQDYLKIKHKVVKLNKRCRKCRYLDICNGGCYYRRLNKKNTDYLCKANIKIFKHIEKKIKDMNLHFIISKLTNCFN